MSLADDILFETVDLDQDLVPAWLKLAQDVTEYIKQNADRYKPAYPLYAIDRPRPAGSLTLEGLARLYHENGQNRFFLVNVGRSMKVMESCPWNGQIEWLRYEIGKAPRLGGPCTFSIRDLNLVPNTYTRHFVFANGDDAHTYMVFI